MLRDQPDFQTLLLLHGRDRRQIAAKKELAGLPADKRRMAEAIDLENQTIDSAREELLSLETQGNALETEIDSLETKVTEQKTKQLAVKRNEEYQALENEIAGLAKQIAEKEDEQIKVLMKTDEAKDVFSIAEGKLAARVKELEEQLAKLDEREKFLHGELEELIGQIEETSGELDPAFLREYQRVKTVVKRPPFLATVEDQKCSGCNLRVSNDVVSSILVEQKLTTCDQCGRLVYYDR